MKKNKEQKIAIQIVYEYYDALIKNENSNKKAKIKDITSKKYCIRSPIANCQYIS